MSFGAYLRRPPTSHLLVVIAVAVSVHVGLGTLLWHVVPHWPWVRAYLVSATSGITASLALAWILYSGRRH